MQKAKHHKKERKNFAFGISFTEMMISFAAGVSGAFLSASDKIWELFDKDQARLKPFNDHFDGFTVEDKLNQPNVDAKSLIEKWNEEMMDREKKGTHIPKSREVPIGRKVRLDAINLEPGQSPSKYWNSISAEKKEIYKDYLAVVKRVHGISSIPILGTIERFRMLSPKNKKTLIVPGAIGATIGTAMTLGFFNGVATRDIIEDIRDSVKPQPEDKVKHTPAKQSFAEKRTTARLDKLQAQYENDTTALLNDAPTPRHSHVDKLVTESADQADLKIASR